MKNRKIIKYLLTILSAVMILSGCNQKVTDFNVRDMSDLMLEELDFEDELQEISIETAGLIYDFSDVTMEDSIIYESSGATAEEIVIVQCQTEKDAETVKEKFLIRIKSQKQSFADYIPEEILRLDNAVATIRGRYAIFCVSGDKALAKQLINSMALRE